MKKPALLILADDLTGALDTGIQFSKNKISTIVIPSPEINLKLDLCPEVLVINTNTRHRSPAEAWSIINFCAKLDTAFIYKKTDSTLRGHIGAELDAFINARNTKLLPFVPAYPALGRTTKDGYQYLHGKTIDRSETASDPLNPVKTGFIPDIIKEESNVQVMLIKQGGEIPDSNDGRKIMVFDSDTKEDLQKIAIELFNKNLLAESAGCAGFAQALLEVLPLKRSEDSFTAQISKQTPILLISGSLSPISIEQTRTAMNHGIPGVSVSEEKLVKPKWFNSDEALFLVTSCVKSLMEHGVFILGTEMAMGSSPEKVLTAAPEEISIGLGRLYKMIVNRNNKLTLAVFGGDTLLGIIKSMEYSYISPLEEIKEGVVLSLAEGHRGNSFIITKAGAFGGKEIISKIINYVKNA